MEGRELKEDATKQTTELARRDKEGEVSALLPVVSTGHLALLDSRIGDPATPVEEAIALTRIRGEIVKQEEFRLDKAGERRAEARQYLGKLGFSALAVCTGVGLIATGTTWVGFVILGVGFHWLAPDFVTNVYSRILGAKDKTNAE
jgi:hypothetical protein